MIQSISFYPRVSDIGSLETIPLDLFLDNIRTGVWEDQVNNVRLARTEQARYEEKKRLPSVTISGIFSERKDDSIKTHSGYISIDVDSDGLPPVTKDSLVLLSPTETKSIVCPDKYVAAAFITASNKGMCLLFRVDPAKHREAFQGIGEYLFSRYGIIIDPTSINPSRARFVSYDPDIYIATHSVPRFTEYPKKKEITIKKYDKVVYTSDDFSEILNQIVASQINITQDSYFVWLRLGFALTHKFSESGRQFFHMISQYSTKYDSIRTDRQYTNCLKHHNPKSEITISSFYFYAKEAGVKIYSDRTRKIAYTAAQGKKSGLSAPSIVTNLQKYEDITGEDVRSIVDQVLIQGIDIGKDDEFIEQLEMFLRQNYNLRRNVITRYIENHSTILEQKDLNSIYIRLKKLFPKVPYEIIDKLINSDFVQSYNPLINYLNDKL